MDDSEEIITTDDHDQTSEQQQNNITSGKQTFDEQATNSNVARTKKISVARSHSFCVTFHVLYPNSRDWRSRTRL